MPTIRFATWNAEGMFARQTVLYDTKDARSYRTRRASPEDAVAALKTLNADIVTIPEFGADGEIDAGIMSKIEAMGYAIVTTPYGDHYSKDFRFAVLSRLPLVEHHARRLGGLRNALEITCTDARDEPVRVIGVHLDDHNELRRIQETRDLAKLIRRSRVRTIVAGDYNAMRYESWFARGMRTWVVAGLVRLMPPSLLRYVVNRAREMARGQVIRYLEDNTDLIDLEPGHSATMTPKNAKARYLPSIPLAKIDWIFGSRDFEARSYQVWRDVGSDHRPVVAVLTY